jgi:hypothetical protein
MVIGERMRISWEGINFLFFSLIRGRKTRSLKRRFTGITGNGPKLADSARLRQPQCSVRLGGRFFADCTVHIAYPPAAGPNATTAPNRTFTVEGSLAAFEAAPAI